MTSDLSSALEVCLRDTLYKSTFTLLYFQQKYLKQKQQAVTVMVATVRIAAEYGSFNRIHQVAPK